jgi:hypothetical protein
MHARGSHERVRESFAGNCHFVTNVQVCQVSSKIKERGTLSRARSRLHLEILARKAPAMTCMIQAKSSHSETSAQATLGEQCMCG